MSTDPHTYDGEVATSMSCHECGKNFIAMVDYRLDGNHILECAHCGHEHWRVIQKGKVTSERFGSSYGTKLDAHRPKRVWKSENGVPVATSSASMFLRERWLGIP